MALSQVLGALGDQRGAARSRSRSVCFLLSVRVEREREREGITTTSESRGNKQHLSARICLARAQTPPSADHFLPSLTSCQLSLSAQFP